MVMSFGLTNAPAHFMYLMNSVFMEEMDKFVVVFIDNILVFSKGKKKHKEHLRSMLSQLHDHQPCAEFSKCDIWLSKVQFVIHVISSGGIFVDPGKVQEYWIGNRQGLCIMSATSSAWLVTIIDSF
jgi:hypothetical protein